MSFFAGFAIYFIMWWTTLFMVLPIGARSQAEDGEIIPGTEPGAPVKSNLGKKLIWNTLLAGVFFAIYYVITVVYGLGFDDIPSIFPDRGE